MAVSEPKLSPRQQKALLALLAQPTIALAAARANLGERTLYRWLAEDEVFRAAYRKARREAVAHATARLQQASEAAVMVLQHVMMDSEVRPSNRIMAARAILELTLKSIELEDLEARIEALEGIQTRVEALEAARTQTRKRYR